MGDPTKNTKDDLPLKTMRILVAFTPSKKVDRAMKITSGNWPVSQKCCRLRLFWSFWIHKEDIHETKKSQVTQCLEVSYYMFTFAWGKNGQKISFLSSVKFPLQNLRLFHFGVLINQLNRLFKLKPFWNLSKILLIALLRIEFCRLVLTNIVVDNSSLHRI